MNQARDPREQDQPGGAVRPQPGQNVSQFLEKNPFSVNNPLGSGTNPLLPSPASLQLAQLQAQLTLQRLKLAQSAVTSNTAAATVLSQVLSKVAMSQPLFNPLRNATMMGAHGHAGMASLGPAMHNARFPSTGLPFSAQNPSAMAPKHTQNPNQNSMPHFGKVMSGNKLEGFHTGSQPYGSETEQSEYHGFSCGQEESADGHYPPKHNNAAGFKNQYFGTHVPHHPVSHKGDTSQGVHNVPSNSQWESSHHWQPSGQPYDNRSELYNPEEPTSDTKFSPSSTPVFSRQNNGKATNCVSSLKNLKPQELNDFQGIPPIHLPHTCTMCNKKVFNLKDWELHIKGRMHIQNVMAYSESVGINCVPNSSNSPMNSDFHARNNEAIPFIPSAVTFPGPPMGAKRKSNLGRVVHICNLPEGSCENDVVNLGLPFGKVTNYILMKSTNQAFLEMAYREAAEAMVQYYQEKPAMINDEKLLIRMSKRYMELQLKKPGKTVDAIILDIHSQRERDMFRDTDRYRNERTRSRSPVSRSLSPKSHTPSFTSCSSPHSPLGPSRAEWGNGRESWGDQQSYGRWEDEREQGSWRDNGEEKRDRTDHWVHDRRHYSRQIDKQEMDDRPDGSRGHREKYSNHYSSSRHKRGDGEYYKRESKSKSDSKASVTPGKTKRKEENKSRDTKESHTEDSNKKDGSEPKPNREAGANVPQSPDKKSKISEANEDVKDDKDVQKAGVSKEEMNHNPVPDRAEGDPEEPDIESVIKHKEQDWESGSELEGESWYPTNMEELVTVDEVGEEDFIVEPDITELEEIVPVAQKDSDNCIQICGHGIDAVDLQCTYSERTRSGCSSVLMSCASPRESASPASSCCEIAANAPDVTAKPESSGDAMEESAKSPNRLSNKEPAREGLGHTMDPQNPEYTDKTAVDLCKRTDCQANSNVTAMDEHIQEDRRNKRESESSMSVSSEVKSPEVPELEAKEINSPPSWEQDNVFTELNIPLGVEFVVPRTGFYCKLCGLFYSSEDAAKTSHCRSRVHYRNLQSYLSRLAEVGPEKTEAEKMVPQQEDVGIVPQFEKSRP
ncbi:PREDICTED: RNA-binding protein 20 [Nanorana parkeri]|uniref:RNA-binding protein 20 n=1 Tax=Nanorana parkeri TaxID=125878 RepID=UPI0008546B17|nr:PREDICTED: RNA-binding protein 20 [Nanorana parkeri]